MGFIKKDKFISNKTVIDNSLEVENLGCSINEFDMRSNSATKIPTQASVVDYVKTYATGVQIRGTEQNPTDSRIAQYIADNNINIKAGDSLLYIQVDDDDNIINSKSLKYAPSELTATTIYTQTQDDYGQNHLLGQAFHNSDFNYTYGKTNSGVGVFASPFVWVRSDTSAFVPLDDDRLNVVNAQSDDYCARFNTLSLIVGKDYKIKGTVNSLATSTLRLKLYFGKDSFPDNVGAEQTINAEGDWELDFTAENEDLLVVFFGVGTTNMELGDVNLRPAYTTSRAVTHISVPKIATYTYEAEDIKGDGTLTVAGDGSPSAQPIVFTLEQDGIGVSTVKVRVTASFDEVLDFSSIVSGTSHTFSRQLTKTFDLTVSA